MPTVGDVLTVATRKCRASPLIETPGDRRGEVESLMRFALGRTPSLDEEIEGRPLSRFQRLVARRAAGEPIEYLTRRATFGDLDLEVGRGAFIPRPSSGRLVNAAVDRLSGLTSPVLVDLATGIGPVALSIAKGLPECQVYGVDISTKALALARGNSRALQLSNVRFLRGDLFEPLPKKLMGAVDVITIHPPYAARWMMAHVRYEMRFEPVESITDSSSTGLKLVRSVIGQAPRWLRPGGWLLVQIVQYRTREVSPLFRRAGFRDLRHLREKGDPDRILAGRLGNPPEPR